MSNTTIQIKRSFANNSPASLQEGELGYSFTSNTLFIGSVGNTPITITSANLSDRVAAVEANASSAANTVRVSLNGTGTLSGKQLNLVDSSDVSFSLSDALNGNANVSATVTSNLFVEVLRANGWIDLTKTASSLKPSHKDGRLWYNANSGTLQLNSSNSSFDVRLGDQLWFYGLNNTGSVIPKGSPVYISGTDVDPSYGQIASIALADASNVTKKDVVGLVPYDVQPNESAHVVVSGYVVGIDTSNLTTGERCHLDWTNEGKLVDAPAAYPNYPMEVGTCVQSGLLDGIVFVDIKDHTSERIRVLNESYFDSDVSVYANVFVTGDQTVTGNVYASGVNLLDFINLTSTTANSANLIAISAYGQANAAYAQANIANSIAISAYTQANLAYSAANTANSVAIAAYSQANSAYAQANLAYSAANNSANTVKVTANSGSTLSNVSLNFVNTSTVQVSVTSGGSGIANVAFTSTATGGGTGTLNNFPVSANAGSTVSANGINFVNSATVTVTVSQGIGGNANISFTSTAVGTGTVTQVNTGIGLTGGPITSTGTISANIASTTVQGVTKLIDSVASTDTANAATGAAVKTAFDQASAAYTQANTANSVAISAYGQANLAYTQANVANTVAVAAYGQANAAYDQANTANTVAFSAYVQANAARDQANSAYTRANTANSVAVSAYGQANLAYTQANTGTSVALSAYGQANLAYTQANLAYSAANTANSTAVSAYNQANVANSIANSAYNQANLAYSAANTSANTVRITANSVSAITGSINFVNTSTSLVSVTSGGSGIANVAITALTNYETIADATGDVHGVVDRTASTLSFNDSTRQFTIAPVSGSWTFYHKGVLHTISTSLSVTIANTSGARFIRVDPTTDTLIEGGSVPDFTNDTIVSYIYFNATTGKGLILGDERHGYRRDTTWHSNQHLNVGTVWRSGGSLSYALNDDANVSIAVGTPLLIADEDLLHTITNSATPTADYQQPLSPTANVEVLYLDGTGYYANTTPNATPWVAGTSLARYNSVTGGLGSLVDASESNYITYWLLATNDTRRPVKLVMGRASHANVDSALAEEFQEYGLSFAEQVFMYQIILKTSSAYSNNYPKVVISSVRKVTSKIGTSASTVTAASHGNLTGRDSADQHPTSAITGLDSQLTSLSVKANGAYTQANAAYVQANLAYGQANTGTSIAQSAYGQANLAYAQANTGTNTAIAAYGQANAAYTQANNAYTQANVANSLAASAYGQANVAYTQANTANSVAVAAYGQANAAYSAANTSGNTVRVSANSGSTLSNKQLNFINTSTITVSVVDSGTGNANISFTSAGGTGAPGGSNTQIQYNNNGTLGGSARFTYNTSPNLVSVDADLKLANTNKLYFGGEQANNSVANSKFSISFNVSATSLDFTFLG